MEKTNFLFVWFFFQICEFDLPEWTELFGWHMQSGEGRSGLLQAWLVQLHPQRDHCSISNWKTHHPYRFCESQPALHLWLFRVNIQDLLPLNKSDFGLIMNELCKLSLSLDVKEGQGWLSIVSGPVSLYQLFKLVLKWYHFESWCLKFDALIFLWKQWHTWLWGNQQW